MSEAAGRGRGASKTATAVLGAFVALIAPPGRLDGLVGEIRVVAELQVISAVVDRIEKSASGERLAVLLLGDEEIERVVPYDLLPKGTREGSWVKVSLADGEISGVQPDPAAREAARARLEAKLEELRRLKGR